MPLLCANQLGESGLTITKVKVHKNFMLLWSKSSMHEIYLHKVHLRLRVYFKVYLRLLVGHNWLTLVLEAYMKLGELGSIHMLQFTWLSGVLLTLR